MNVGDLPELDLAACAREPIHLLGRIQPHGFLIGMDANWTITHLSENVDEFLAGISLADIGGDLSSWLPPAAVHAIRNALQHVMNGPGSEIVHAVPMDGSGRTFDLTLHISGRTIVVEGEPADPGQPLETDLSIVRSAMERLGRRPGVREQCDDCVRFVRALTGFDRVMLYQFLPDGSGEVISEICRAGLDPYLGLRYPATDIPEQARRLYLQNPIRLIADVSRPGRPVRSTGDSQDAVLDLSASVLRSVSEIHLEYLRNMDVAASMSISVLVDGGLWGLIACHHAEPKALGATKRNASLLFGQMFSLQLQSQLAREERRHDETAHEITSMLSRQASASFPIDELLQLAAQDFQALLKAQGSAVVIDGKATVAGDTPSLGDIQEICRRLNERHGNEVFETHQLRAEFPYSRAAAGRSAGLLSIPISRSPRDYLLFFRNELVTEVSWAGNPDKAAAIDASGRISPRKSFAAWREVVSGQSEAWLPAEIRAAKQLRTTMLEVVLRLTDEAAREKRSASERQELLIAELNHRVRNILGLVRSLVAKSSPEGSTTEGFVSVLDARIQALARAHDQITEQNWSHASLKRLIGRESESYLLDRRNRLQIEGDDMLLAPVAFSAVALVMHELVTNSAKYGALSVEQGTVTVSLAPDETGALQIDWAEHGGPPVAAPTRRGFGSVIIERSIPYELNGAASIDYDPAGVRARFTIPETYVRPAEPAAAQAAMDEDADLSARIAAPENVMIVEDNLIIAMEAESIFLDLGARNVAIFARSADALRHLETADCDLALLDFNLGQGTSIGVAQALAERRVPFIFTSGYGDNLDLPEPLASAPRLAKPYNSEMIARILKRIFGDGR